MDFRYGRTTRRVSQTTKRWAIRRRRIVGSAHRDARTHFHSGEDHSPRHRDDQEIRGPQAPRGRVHSSRRPDDQEIRDPRAPRGRKHSPRRPDGLSLWGGPLAASPGRPNDTRSVGTAWPGPLSATPRATKRYAIRKHRMAWITHRDARTTHRVIRTTRRATRTTRRSSAATRS